MRRRMKEPTARKKEGPFENNERVVENYLVNLKLDATEGERTKEIKT